MQPPLRPIAQLSNSLCAACRAPFLHLALPPHAASQDWLASPVPAASRTPLQEDCIRAYAALHGMKASLKSMLLKPICDISSPKLLNRTVSSRLNTNGLRFPCPIRKAIITCQWTQEKALVFVSERVGWLPVCSRQQVLCPYLIPQSLVSLPVPPVQLQLDESFKKFPSWLRWLNEPETSAHAWIYVICAPWVIRPVWSPIEILIWQQQASQCCSNIIVSKGWAMACAQGLQGMGNGLCPR